MKKWKGPLLIPGVKFSIEDEGSIVVDSDGVRISEEETGLHLNSITGNIPPVFLNGEMNATEAYMTPLSKGGGIYECCYGISSILS